MPKGIPVATFAIGDERTASRIVDAITERYPSHDLAIAAFEVPGGRWDITMHFAEAPDEDFIRQFLGRMLFTGEESRKSVTVLSGGEKVRCMLARLMLENPQCLILDGPTNHLDLESINALNNALSKRSGTLIFGSHDVELIESLTDRVIEITDEGLVDHQYGYAELRQRRTEESAVLVGA